MSLAETKQSEIIYARWSHARRHMIMTRAVSLMLMITSGLVMTAAFTETERVALAQSGYTSDPSRQSQEPVQRVGDPVRP